jgi:hypothetical protein
MRLLRLIPILLACLVLLTACASGGGSKTDSLDRVQYAWSGAIRWGDFEGALNLIDAKERAKLSPTAVEMERYKQVQIAHYRDLGEDRDLEAGTAVRDVEIGVINRHTQAQRVVRYRERWRWDPESRGWWNTSGLPDLWQGQ